MSREIASALLEEREPNLPDWWYGFDLADLMRKNGFDVNFQTVADLDPFVINAVHIREAVKADPKIDKARKYVEQKNERRNARRKKGGHLKDVSHGRG